MLLERVRTFAARRHRGGFSFTSHVHRGLKLIAATAWLSESHWRTPKARPLHPSRPQ